MISIFTKKTYNSSFKLIGSKEKVFEFHSCPKNLKHLTPSFIPLKIKSDNKMANNVIVFMKFMFFIPWEAKFQDIISGKQFTDIQIRGPFAFWKHKHSFIDLEEHTIEIHDHIEFKLRKNPIYLLIGIIFAITLPLMFRFRKNQLKKMFFL